MEEAVLKELYRKAGRRERVTITISAPCTINARSALLHLAGGSNQIEAAGFRVSLNEFELGIERGIDLKEYLDNCIRAWREKKKIAGRREPDISMAQSYIDAFQSVRMTVFDELLEEDE